MKSRADYQLFKERYKMLLLGTLHSSGSRKIDDLWRDLVLVANKWRVLRFWVYELREDMDACLRKIKDSWNNNNIS